MVSQADEQAMQSWHSAQRSSPVVKVPRQGKIPMVTDDKFIREMMSYYDERAEEYEEIYLGKGHATIDPDAYRKDVAQVSEMVSRFGGGHLIDIGCGAGFWCPSYARNCNQITFLDQSERMLSKCKDVTLETCKYDCALVGFLLSHLTFQQEKIFFEKLGEILKTNSQLMFIDSIWNERRQQYREKEGIQERVLSDGRIFRVYKRYFDESDVEEMLKRYKFEVISYYTGEALIAAIAEGCL
jgi:SAM-dependent methyltransferase